MLALFVMNELTEEQTFYIWFGHGTVLLNGAKLGVAPVARAPPLFLPCPELKYIYVLHTSAPPRTYLVRATLLLSPDWRHCVVVNIIQL